MDTTIPDNFFITGGTLPPTATSYVVRQADRDLVDNLLRGEFCFVLNTRQMGKSSLMIRTAQRLRAQGVRAAILDLTAIGQNLAPNQWYIGLLTLLGEQLDLEDDLSDFWMDNTQLGAMQRFFAALRQVVLPALQPAASIGQEVAVGGERSPIPIPTEPEQEIRAGHLVLFVDEIDVVQSLPFSADEFFAGIRECYNRRSQDPLYQRLTFCLLGVATPADLIQDMRTSPFNIGKRIELRDFTAEEATTLAPGLESTIFTQEHGKRAGASSAPHRLLQRVLYWTGGHPYMTQRLCRAVADAASERAISPADVDRLCHGLFLSKAARESDDNLAFVRNRLLRSGADISSLLDLYTRIRNGKTVRDDETNPLCATLRLSGAVRVDRGTLHLRNRIYAHVFDQEWVRSHMPDAELRRQRAAYRRGMLRAGALFSGVTLMVGLLAFVALRQKLQADILAAQSRQEASRANLNALHLQQEKQVAQQALEDARQQKGRADRNAQEARKAAHSAGEAKRDADAQAKRAMAAAQGEKRQRDRAELLADRARQEARTSRRLSYMSQMALAYQAWQSHFAGRARELLLAQNPPPGVSEDLRGFEWRLLWNRCQSRDLLATLPNHKDAGHTNAVIWVTLSPDGRMLATCGADSQIKLWNARTYRLITTLSDPNSHRYEITGLSFSPNGKYLASCGRGFRNEKDPKHINAPKIALWDLETRKIVRIVPGSSDNHMFTLAFSPDSQRVVVGASWGNVSVWDIAGKSYRAIAKHSAPVFSVSFSPNGKWIASIGLDGVLILNDAATGKEVKRVDAHVGWGWHAEFSPDSRMLATCGNDKKIKLWEVPTLEARGELTGHNGTVPVVAFSPNGKLLASGSFDQTVRLWDVTSRRAKAIFQGHAKQAGCVVFSKDGSRLFSGSVDSTIKVWDVAGSQASDILNAHQSKVNAVAVSPDSRWLVSTGDEETFLWDLASRTMVQPLVTENGGYRYLAFTPDGKRLVAGNGSAIHFWRTSDWKRVYSLPHQKTFLPAIALSRDGRRLAAAENGETISLWDVERQRKIGAFPAPTNLMRSLLFSQDGQRLYAGSEDHSVRWWDLDGSGRSRIIPIGRGPVVPMALSHDGRTLAMGNMDNTIYLWDVAKDRLIGSLKGHTSFVMGLAFSADGKTLASGADDKTVKLWNLATRQEIVTFDEYADAAWCLTFSPDDRTLVVGSWDKTVHLYRADPRPDRVTVTAR